MTDLWLRDQGLRDQPQGQCRARLLLAHGAGAPMDSDVLQVLASALAGQGIDVLRFEFPYMANRRTGGSRRPPDPMPVLLEAYRDQVQQVCTKLESAPLFIGGKSLGGRVASMLVDELASAYGVQGAICFGYPFHPPAKPERLRTEHLAVVKTPILIVQGTRDPLGTQAEVQGYTLSPAVRMHWLADGDHDFKPRRASGFTQQQHLIAAAGMAADFMTS